MATIQEAYEAANKGYKVFHSGIEAYIDPHDSLIWSTTLDNVEVNEVTLTGWEIKEPKYKVVEALEKAGWVNSPATNVWLKGTDEIDEDNVKELFEAWDEVNGR